MKWQDHITSAPTTLFRKPTIRGTRILIDLIPEKMGNGESFAYLLEAYPQATEADLLTCLLFASDVVKNEITYVRAG